MDPATDPNINLHAWLAVVQHDPQQQDQQEQATASDDRLKQVVLRGGEHSITCWRSQ